ncbi:MAG: site-specific DNA-methyltransferase [Sorangiineae bacterium]|nr:site-specific DNA-methyltransferase [Polyangiaceae bacterium]MEB2324321.1 site-specific DNA-methyltransferase [Sorangiineae bacterium]
MSAARESILHGDCLEVVPSLEPGFELVYMDPPFNAGGARRARGARGDRARGAAAYRDSWGGLDAFLVMLRPRLGVVRDAMAERSGLFLHLDHRAVHDAKVLADGVFGRAQFRGELIWTPGNGGRGRGGPRVTHQTILIYSRGRELVWNDDHPALREPYAATSLEMHFRSRDADGRRYRERTIAGRTYRYYADHGRRLGSVWTDLPAMRANTPLVKETTGYPTQKPESLLERIILIGSREGARVLDPMCGSGTAVAVARRLGREATGVDASEVACELARARLRAS